MVEVINVTDDTFQKEVIDSDVPVIVDFWVEGVGLYHLIAPKDLEGEYGGKIKVVKVSVDEAPVTFKMFEIQGPTVLTFCKGHVELRL